MKGIVVSYPNADWNNGKFICVQSVFVDERNVLWILDPGYELSTDSTRGAHIYAFNLEKNTLLHEFILLCADG